MHVDTIFSIFLKGNSDCFIVSIYVFCKILNAFSIYIMVDNKIKFQVAAFG